MQHGGRGGCTIDSTALPAAGPEDEQLLPSRLRRCTRFRLPLQLCSALTGDGSIDG
jgi:hypothetical protein